MELLGSGTNGVVRAAGEHFAVKEYQSPEEASREHEAAIAIEERVAPAGRRHLLWCVPVGNVLLMRRARPLPHEFPGGLRRAAVHLFRAVDALQLAGLVHGDIKLSNVGVVGNDLVLFDFGNMCLPDGGDLTRETCSAHTRPPEEEVHHRSDVYSAAMTVLEIVLGWPGMARVMRRCGQDTRGETVPRPSHHAVQHMLRWVPDRAIRAALARALEPSPHLRPDADAVLADLTRPR